MAFTNIGVGSCPVANGYVTLNESLNDYPKLTVVEYTNSSPGLATGTGFGYFGLSFLLEGISVDICPVPGFEKQVTYTYVHVSKKILEYPINVYDFVQANKNSVLKKTPTSYFFSIGSLISWASGKSGGGGVSAPSFSVEFSKTPGTEETTTLKQQMDDYMQMKGLVFQFGGGSASASAVGTGGGVSSSIVSNYTIAKNAVPTYKRTILSWSKEQEFEENPLEIKKYRRLDNNEYVIYEGDYIPHLPPGEDGTDGILPKDLSIMMDNSGVTKSCKITKYVWGQPEVEISATFGYAHAALELVADPKKPNKSTEAVLAALNGDVINSGNAFQEVLQAIQNGKYGFPDDANWADEPVWRLINVKETEYVYQPLNLNLRPVLKKEDGTLEPVIIPPEYNKFLYSKLEVLAKEVTTGWELKRFAQEDPAEWTKGSIAAWLSLDTLVKTKESLAGNTFLSKRIYNWMLYSAKVSLEQYLYRRIPLWEEIRYAIVPYSKYYKDLEEVDWEVQYIPKNQLPGQDDEDDTPVPVLFPDPNWVPELMLLARSRYKSAFGLSGNPQYNPFVRNYYGSNPVTITSGSEEYEMTKYGILPSKNTRPEVTNLHKTYANVEEILATIGIDATLPGTYYEDAHPYMNISDYGIRGVTPPEVSPGKVAAKYPSRNKDREDQYTTTTSLRVAQDQSFKSFITTQSFSIADGRPPRATVRKPVYEEEKEDAKKDSPYENSVTYVTSSISNGGIDVVPSVSVPGARNIEEAVEGAQNQLMMNILTSGSSASAQLLWTGIGRSIVNGRVALPQGSWVIKSSTQTVQAANGVTFAQPIQIEAGNYIVPGVSATTVQIEDENKEQSSVKVIVDANLPVQLGTPLQSLPPNFSRWLI